MTNAFDRIVVLTMAAKPPPSQITIPPQFRESIERHHQNLIALSAALRSAGVSPLKAADYVDAALASFRDGLMASIAELEDAQ